MKPKSYFSLKAELEGLSPPERDKRFDLLDRRIAKTSFDSLSAEERYEFAWLIAAGSYDAIGRITSFPEETKTELVKLFEIGRMTVPRIQAKLFLHLVETGRFDRGRYAPFREGPAIVFVVSPTNNSLGLRARGQRISNPPVGIYNAASILELFGVRTYVFELGLGDSERQQYEATIEKELSNLWFISLSSRFLGRGELDLVFQTTHFLDSLDAGGLRPRFTGGSIGPLFFNQTALKHTPIEVIIVGYSELSMADMIFDSDFQGPADHRPALELFNHIPNLAIAVKDGPDAAVHTTPTEECPDDQRRLLAAAFDIAKVPYSTKYWPRKLMIDICSPDDLNLPIPPEWGAESTEPPPKLHLANYLFKPRQLRYLSLIGNCPRNCKFCHWRAFDDSRFVIPYPELVEQINRVVRVYPEAQMIGWLDDDFLLWKSDLVDFLKLLQQNEPGRHMIYCFETLPQYMKPELLPELKKANFKAILLGFESPVERVLRDMRKLHRNESYETFVARPRLVHDAGFFTRCSTITFYPTITEEEVAQTIRGLTDFLDCGISVEVYAYVMALGGSEYAETKEHDIVYDEYTLPNGSGVTLQLPSIVLPDDPVVRELAQRAIDNTPGEIKAILAENKIQGDFPMSLCVLAYLRAIVKSWQAIPQRTLKDETLAALERHVDEAIERMVVRHFVQLRTQEALERYQLFGEDGYSLIEPDLKRDGRLSYVWVGLRMALDFGDDSEIYAAARLAERLAQTGYYDRNAYESLETRLNHPAESIRLAAEAARDALERAG